MISFQDYIIPSCFFLCVTCPLCFGLYRLSILLNWLHERDPVRYDVFCTQIKVAGKAGMIDQITVSLDQVCKNKNV